MNRAASLLGEPLREKARKKKLGSREFAERMQKSGRLAEDGPKERDEIQKQKEADD